MMVKLLKECRNQFYGEQDNSPWTIAPRQLPPRTMPPRTNPPWEFPTRTIAPQTITPGQLLAPVQFPPRKISPKIIAPAQFPPRIIDPQGRWPMDIFQHRTIPIRVIFSRRLCLLKIFYCLSFCLPHNKIRYKHKHAFFQNKRRVVLLR